MWEFLLKSTICLSRHTKKLVRLQKEKARIVGLKTDKDIISRWLHQNLYDICTLHMGKVKVCSLSGNISFPGEILKKSSHVQFLTNLYIIWFVGTCTNWEHKDYGGVKSKKWHHFQVIALNTWVKWRHFRLDSSKNLEMCSFYPILFKFDLSIQIGKPKIIMVLKIENDVISW